MKLLSYHRHHYHHHYHHHHHHHTLDGSFEESFACLTGGYSVVVTTRDVATNQTGPLARVILLLDQILGKGGGDGGGGALEGVRGGRGSH